MVELARIGPWVRKPPSLVSQTGVSDRMESPHENPIHYPEDRRHRAWVSRRMLLILGGLALAPVAAA